LPMLILQYKDYSEWQNSKKEQEALKQQEEFWLKKFSGGVEMLNLPLDFKRPLLLSYEGSAIEFSICKEDTRWLKELALSFDTTLFMVLLALFNVLLSKKSGQEDILVGTPIAGRRIADLEPIIGVFINTLVLRNYPKAGKNFSDFLKEVTAQTLEAFKNQDYPFENLVEKLVSRRDTSRHPLLDVMFEIRMSTRSQDLLQENLTSDTSGLKLFPYKIESQIARFDLDWFGVEHEGEVFFTVSYCTKLFEKVSVELMADEYLALIKSLKNKGDGKIIDLNCTTSIERDFQAGADVEFSF